MNKGARNLEAMEFAINYNNYLLNRVNQSAPINGTVLDFGAGTGTFAKKLQSANRDLIAVEISEDLHQNFVNTEITVIDNTKKLADKSIDFIYTLNVLEHIENDSLTLIELNRILKTNGKLLIYVPAFDLLFSGMDRLVGHFRRYRMKQLRTKLELTGYKVLKSEYVDSLGFFVTLIYKYLPKQNGKLNPKHVQFYDRLIFPISAILDFVFHKFFGKNLIILATKSHVSCHNKDL